jgi:hypothetical protein
VLRPVRGLLATADHERKAGRASRGDSLAYRHDQARGRTPPGDLHHLLLYMFAQDTKVGQTNGEGLDAFGAGGTPSRRPEQRSRSRMLHRAAEATPPRGPTDRRERGTPSSRQTKDKQLAGAALRGRA